MKVYSEKFKKRRKFLLVIPILVLPFITVIFWVLGGGQQTRATPAGNDQAGFNTQLPDAELPAGTLDKMSLYRLAERDSQAWHEARMQDPYAGYHDSEADNYMGDMNESGYESSDYIGNYGDHPGIYGSPDPNEVKVRRRLSQLEDVLNASSEGDLYSINNLPKSGDTGNEDIVIPRLSQLPAGVLQENNPDPELQQLNGMLEKILDIQHPDRVQKQLKAQSEKHRGQVFPVTTDLNTGIVTLLRRPFTHDLPDDSISPFTGDPQNAFYDLNRSVGHDVVSGQAIPAVTSGRQTLVAGGTVKLRLMKDVFVDGRLIPKNTSVFGIGTVTGERLDIQVKNIRYGENIFPVSLNVFDMDGMKGIRIPGAVTRDAAKEGTERAVRSLQLMDMNPSLATQAAGAGIETVRGLLGSKAKLVRVTVKAGYPVLLVDEKTMQQ